MKNSYKLSEKEKEEDLSNIKPYNSKDDTNALPESSIYQIMIL